ncbi:MAG: hypothetical protein ABI587_00455 [Gemmatimonadales bacterium]
MKIPGALPIGPSIATRITRAYGLPGQVAPPSPAAPKATEVTDAMAEMTTSADGAQGLRAVLSEDERAYFDQIAQLGPITYGPGRQRGMTPEAPRGLRIDVTG